MNHYRHLAARYLKLNQRRSIVTIMGVALAVAVLYTLLNYGWSYVLTTQEADRSRYGDYEIILFTETEDQIEQILRDDRVKSAYTGEYYDEREHKHYAQVLYINTTQPYRMKRILTKMTEKYGVNGILNRYLDSDYFQETGDLVVVVFLFVLLISYIFALFGVGILRNSIQMFTMEQIKDYGNLRCIGATRKQLKSIVYMEGMLLEGFGIAIGIMLGTAFDKIMAILIQMNMDFHLLPVIPILIAFFGDLYFATEENCKVIVNLTPVSAVRGEYRIRKEKIRIRKKNIFGRLFGIEGDYAFKSIMRNPGRFYKTIWTLGIGIAGIITFMGFVGAVYANRRDLDERTRYYQIYYENTLGIYSTIDEVQSTLPSAEYMEEIAGWKETVEAKKMYSAEMVLADWEEVYGHYLDAFLQDTSEGDRKHKSYDMVNSLDKTDPDNGYASWISNLNRMITYGYDQKDIERLKDKLVEGTLDVDQNGVILVNGGYAYPKSSDEDWLSYEIESYSKCIYTDYHVGDTISLVNTERLKKLIREHMDQYQKEYEKKNGKDDGSEMYNWKYEKYFNKEYRIAAQCYIEQLTAEGDIKTYTIEGIVSENANYFSAYGDEMALIFPLESYYDVTGTDESMMTGMQYHFDHIPRPKYGELRNPELTCMKSDYLRELSTINSILQRMYGVMAIVVFVLVMSSFNIINTAAGNLFLRRKELAQLRVIGVSKTQLIRIVLLEGVITNVLANGIGLLFGSVLNILVLDRFYHLLFNQRFRFPVVTAVVCVLLSTCLLCGSLYFPLRRMNLNMAEDLATGGE